MISGPKPYIPTQIQLKNQTKTPHIQTKIYSDTYSLTLDSTPDIRFRPETLHSASNSTEKSNPTPKHTN